MGVRVVIPFFSGITSIVIEFEPFLVARHAQWMVC